MTGPYHIETIPLICRANQWTGFYMIGTYVMKESSYINANTILPCITIAKSSILAWGLRISKNTNVSFNQNWLMFSEFGIIKNIMTYERQCPFVIMTTFQPQIIELHPKLSVQDFIASQGRESIQCFPSVFFTETVGGL